nr:cysteine hydrolase family protein [Acinetobacter sp. Marseille-Q1620]
MSNNIKRALVVIDVQNEYFSGNLKIAYPDPETAINNVVKAIETAKNNHIPVIIVQNFAPENAQLFAQGSIGAELHPKIIHFAKDHYVVKSMPSAFSGTDLEEWIKINAIDTLTVVGFMTQNCDDSTIKHALHLGLNVEFLSDASGAVPYKNRAGYASAEEIHRIFCVVMQARFAAVLSTHEWINCVHQNTAPIRETIFQSHENAKAYL